MRPHVKSLREIGGEDARWREAVGSPQDKDSSKGCSSFVYSGLLFLPSQVLHLLPVSFCYGRLKD